MHTKADTKFKKLSKAEKRVVIAKDVLKYLKSGKITAQQGDYVQLDCLEGKVDSLCEFIEKTPTCSVCALGAVFVAGVMKDCAVGDGFLQLEEYYGDHINTHFDEDRDRMRENLAPYFSIKQLDLIENAFESSMINMPDTIKQDDRGGIDNADCPKSYQKAVAFIRGYEEVTDDQRLKRIMSNVIENRGTFKP